jgi:hypothetical protein
MINDSFDDSVNNINESSLNVKRICKLNKMFVNLRNSLNISIITRKCQFDSMLKKVKAKVFKIIHHSLQRCYVDKYKLARLPQAFITNIKIEFNKYYLSRSILQIYSEFDIFKSHTELIEAGLIKEEKKSVLEKFLNLTLEEVYDYYITSKRYQKDKEKIINKDGSEFAILFNFIAENIISYYKNNKGNKPKRKKHDEKKLFKICNN